MHVFPNNTYVYINNNNDEYHIYVNGEGSHFEIDEQFNIISEHNDGDSEAYNDVARWLLMTLLEIERAEKVDQNMHCDWSAEPRYTFKPALRRCINESIHSKFECALNGRSCKPDKCTDRRIII